MSQKPLPSDPEALYGIPDIAYGQRTRRNASGKPDLKWSTSFLSLRTFRSAGSTGSATPPPSYTSVPYSEFGGKELRPDGRRPTASLGGKRVPASDDTTRVRRRFGVRDLSAAFQPGSIFEVLGGPDEMCIVCGLRPRRTEVGKRIATCGRACADKLSSGLPSTSNYSSRKEPPKLLKKQSSVKSLRDLFRPGSMFEILGEVPKEAACVVCKVRAASDYVTCGSACTEKLIGSGGDPTVCNYCHRRPKASGQLQCSKSCIKKAKSACLLCKCRPRYGRYELCGDICEAISKKTTLFEVPRSHPTFEQIEKDYKSAWKAKSTPTPEIQKVYRVVHGKDLNLPYDVYKDKIGNEQTRYHGTKRECQLGVSTAGVCTSSTCRICNILKTSFQVSLADPTSAFGKAIYTSSASNKAYSYCGTTGVMLVTKVVLGNIKYVTRWKEVTSCPSEYHSVVFERQKGTLNETIVYSDEAIRPIFMIVF